MSKENEQILYLSRQDMDRVGPSLAEIVPLLDHCFAMKGQGKTVLPAKHWIERGESRFCSAMSSYIPELGFSGCKWQSGDPANSARGLPYIQGLYVLTEDTFGIPVAIMDAEWITGRRTAAASALAVKYFMNPGASTLAILGCGLQGRAHLEAIRSVMPALARVRVFDIRRTAAESFARELGLRLGLSIEVAASARDAVHGSEVVVSGGPIMTPPKPTIEPDWICDGVVGVTIDYDSYWTPAAMQTMNLIVTDDRGQIEHLKEYGLFLGVPRLDGELADCATGKLSGRRSASERILCFNLGIALEDIVTAVDVYQRAKAAGVGRMLPR
ncbi:MAG: ornithine cyclodeaminase family protein [Alphaproteobacteria bacterium]|nr:ornithine cyclodeaminase family protein [Alphaproteobacteria bacterium]